MLRSTTAVFVAVLVLASGATVGLVAASHAPTHDATTQLPAQDNETMGNETADNETADNETADNETMADGMANETATVTFENQTSDGSSVVVNATSLPEGGYVVIHLANRTSPGNFSVGPVIGNTTYLEPGEHADLVVAIYENETLTESQWLIAMPHLDTDDNQVYEFPMADDPYTADGAPVTQAAYVEVSAAMGNETMDDEEAMGNETMGNETAGNESA